MRADHTLAGAVFQTSQTVREEMMKFAMACGLTPPGKLLLKMSEFDGAFAQGLVLIRGMRGARRPGWLPDHVGSEDVCWSQME